MKTSYFLLIALFLFTSGSCSQKKDNTSEKLKYENVGGMCEGCESIHESPVPFNELAWIDTLPDFSDGGPKIEISGIVYQKDGVTPAPGVVLYLYHTDQDGYYSKKGNETGWGKRHGYIRGWMKTNEKGEYRFYTLRPAPYPGNHFPAHIHMIIKEPDKNEYWIEDYVFDDDPLVNEAYRKNESKRCGTGIITLTKVDISGLSTGKRDLLLGMNIENYPE
jgi:protocatechuate 3,4-dioxygenase beta subunit